MLPLLPLALDANPTLGTTVVGVVADLFSVLGTVATTVKGEALYCIGIAAVLGGIGIAWFKKLTNQRRGRGR